MNLPMPKYYSLAKKSLSYATRNEQTGMNETAGTPSTASCIPSASSPRGRCTLKFLSHHHHHHCPDQSRKE